MLDKDRENKMQILIVDDVPGNIKIIMPLLLPEHRVLAATDGLSALKIAESKQPDLILLDVMMPDIDGFEVCRRLKANVATTNIPVIFITAKNEAIDESMGFELGAVDYITKPISPVVVKARVKTQLKVLALNRSLEQSNQFIRKTFGRYMSDEVVENILDTPEGLRIGGERKLVTVLMSDLRGFTAIGERMSPEEVISMLNMYLETMTKIIHKYNGTIIEFLGDGILALFGAPHTREDDAERAIACALEMQLSMPEVNARNLEHGFVDLEMGCGINTGKVVAGNIGSELRSKYGVVGNAINLAARIESLTVGGQLLVSENSLQACRAQLAISDKWPLRAKGVSDSMTVYNVKGISAPYNVSLPDKPPPVLQQVKDGLAVLLTIIEGKRTGRHAHHGKIKAIALPLLIIESQLMVRVWTNVQIEFVTISSHKISDQIYGKVLDVDADLLQISLTSTPPEAEQILKNWLITDSM